jgi:hypothetical protein
MHGACVFENKEQYDKANKILTVVLQNAYAHLHSIPVSLHECPTILPLGLYGDTETTSSSDLCNGLENLNSLLADSNNPDFTSRQLLLAAPSKTENQIPMIPARQQE